MLEKSAINAAKISIALCTYNGAEFLSEQLESFRKQTRLPDELIIGDDRSSDETVKIIEDFIKTAPFPVHLKVNEKNLGSTENFEQTISRCTGELIFLSDQDDIWLPEKVSAVEEKFKENKDLELVFTDAELIDENSNSIGCSLWDFTLKDKERSEIKNGKSFKTLLRRSVITGATMAFCAEMRRKFAPIPHDIPNALHDWWIALICSVYAEIGFIEKPLIKYRQHTSQQIGVDWQRRKLNDLPNKFSQESSDRSAFYENSIKFSKGEIERLQKTAQFLKDKLKAETSAKIQTDSLEKLTAEFISEKQNMIAHYEARNDLPKNRIKRIFPVLREMFTCRYHNFSRGFYSVGKDLLENWK